MNNIYLVCCGVLSILTAFSIVHLLVEYLYKRVRGAFFILVLSSVVGIISFQVTFIVLAFLDTLARALVTTGAGS